MKRKIDQVARKDENKNSGEVSLSKTPFKPNKRKKMIGKTSTTILHNKDMSKTNWKELKEQKKSLKTLRKKKKVSTHYETIQQAKQLWEVLRKSDCTQNKKSELTQQLLKLLEGKIKNIIRSHDTTRIIQWTIKLGSEEVRNTIIEEILCDTVAFAQCRYATHTVKCILKYGQAKFKKKVIQMFIDNIFKLVSSKVAAPLVEEVYTKFASKKDRKLMKSAFFNKFFINRSSETEGKSLSEFLTDTPILEETVINNQKSTLCKLIQKPGTLNSSLFHSVLYDFLCKCNEVHKTEILEEIQNHIKPLLKSKDGASVVQIVIWNGQNKVKKMIVKNLKEDLKSLAMSEHGSYVLMALIDSVDDTVLMKKAFISVILSHAEEIAKDKHGRRVMLYLVAHRDPTFFYAAELALLKTGDESKHRKKDCDQRMKELLEAVLEPLLMKIADSPEFWFSEGGILIVTQAIVSSALRDGKSFLKAWESISNYITNENSVYTEKENKFYIVENPGVHRVLKKLLQLDQKNIDDSSDCLSRILVDKIDRNVLERWIPINRGCFILVLLCDSSTLAKTLKEKLQEPELLELLKKQESQGALQLMKVLEES